MDVSAGHHSRADALALELVAACLEGTAAGVAAAVLAAEIGRRILRRRRKR